MIKMVMEYCQCADNLPMLVTEVMSKLIETLKVSHTLLQPRTVPSCQPRNETCRYQYGNETLVLVWELDFSVSVWDG